MVYDLFIFEEQQESGEGKQIVNPNSEIVNNLSL